MDPIEDIDLVHSFSDEESTDDMELEHSNDDLFAGIDMNKSGSPTIEPQFSPPENEEPHFPGISADMPWDDKPKVVEKWLQMYQVHSLLSSLLISECLLVLECRRWQPNLVLC